MTKRGAFIVLEGLDRSGKSTQIDKLHTFLCAQGIQSKIMKFPDRSTCIGKVVNDFLCNKKDLSNEVAHLLFSANRWEVRSQMLSDLHEGITLLVDRYAYSGVAYTTAKEGIYLEWARGVDVGLPAPDVVFYLDIDPEIQRQRGSFGAERYEISEFQRVVARQFLKIRDESWQVVDACASVEDVHSQLKERVLHLLQHGVLGKVGRLWVNDTEEC